MEQREQRYECIQVEDAEVVLVAYGISSRVCREAVEIAREEGFKLGLDPSDHTVAVSCESF